MSAAAPAPVAASNDATAVTVKNSSLTGKDVKNKSLTKLDFKGSVRGPRGPQGPQGPPGPAGTAGAQGAPGAANTVVRVGPGGTGSDVALCLAGERVVGGGGFTPDLDGYLWDSSPVDEAGNNVAEGQPARGWAASASIPESASGTGDTGADVQAYVVCAV
jgi:hypothetical protein